VNVVNEMVSDLRKRKIMSRSVTTRKQTVSWRASIAIILFVVVSSLSYFIWFVDKKPATSPVVNVAQFDKLAVVEPGIKNIPTMKTPPAKSDQKPPAKINIADKKTVPAPIKPAITPSTRKTHQLRETPKASRSTVAPISAPATREKTQKKIIAAAKRANEIANKTEQRKKPTNKPKTKIIQAVAKQVLPAKSVTSPDAENQFNKQNIQFSKTQKAKKYYSEALSKFNIGDTAAAKSKLQSPHISRHSIFSQHKVSGGLV